MPKKVIKKVTKKVKKEPLGEIKAKVAPKKIVLDPIEAMSSENIKEVQDTLYFVYSVRLDWGNYLIDELKAILKGKIDDEADGDIVRCTTNLEKK